MQTAESLFRFAGAIIIWSFIGFVAAIGIKAVQRKESIPEWPIAVFALIGIGVSIARQVSAGRF
jgi:hypothetical protein